MKISSEWTRETGPRVEASRDLDASKVQAPGIIERPGGGFRLFYTAVGPGRPYPECQGYILSAVSDDGLEFSPEPGIRLCPCPDVAHMSLRLLAPSIVQLADGRFRMYIEARGTSDRPTVITSAVSEDQLEWQHEEGVRLVTPDGLGGPRVIYLPDGRCRLLACADDYGEGGRAGGQRNGKHIVSAISENGLDFAFEPGERIRSGQEFHDAMGITAGQLLAPSGPSGAWTMVYSAWQDAPAGRHIPTHPSDPSTADTPPEELDFAAASIAADISGFRSRIFQATSEDGLSFGPPECIVAGGGYESDELDAVHAEDMSVITLGDGRRRMYYAACDTAGRWRIASAVTGS